VDYEVLSFYDDGTVDSGTEVTAFSFYDDVVIMSLS
jgi:hypothetical protein